jgi:hypothetical protein
MNSSVNVEVSITDIEFYLMYETNEGLIKESLVEYKINDSFLYELEVFTNEIDIKNNTLLMFCETLQGCWDWYVWDLIKKDIDINLKKCNSLFELKELVSFVDYIEDDLNIKLDSIEVYYFENFNLRFVNIIRDLRGFNLSVLLSNTNK